MIKYNLVEHTEEFQSTHFKYRTFEYTEGMVLDYEYRHTTYPEVIKQFDTKQEALNELKNYYSVYAESMRYFGIIYYEVTEYYVEEVELNEDGEFLSGGDIWGYAPLHPEIRYKQLLDTINNDIYDYLNDNDIEYYRLIDIKNFILDRKYNLDILNEYDQLNKSLNLLTSMNLNHLINDVDNYLSRYSTALPEEYAPENYFDK